MFEGVLLGIRVVVFDTTQARNIYRLGYYGKPLGIPKPKDTEFSAPLELGLIEAIYLTENGLLSVYSTKGKRIDLECLRKYALSIIPRFSELYVVYKDLRDKGYIVRSGLKYGSDFVVYEKGPGLEHAPYLVHVVRAYDQIDPLEIVREGRLGHSVRKDFVLALVYPGDKVSYLLFEWSKP